MIHTEHFLATEQHLSHGVDLALMGRRIKTDVPQVKANFIPQWPYTESFRELDAKFKASQKDNYDKRYRVRELPPLPKDRNVWVNTREQQVPGRILQMADTPRLYVVETPTTQVRRNRTHLRPRSEPTEMNSDESSVTPPRPVTRSQTGVTIHPPDRLRY